MCGRIVGDFGVICLYDTVRFLPTQEWSVCGRGICWWILALCGRQLCDCCRARQRDSCFRRNGLWGNGGLLVIFGIVVPALSPIRPQFVRQIRPHTSVPHTDHSCVGRNLLAMGGIAALITPPLAAHGCEIPAFAGMVCLGIMVCRRILAFLGATIGMPPAADSTRRCRIY